MGRAVYYRSFVHLLLDNFPYALVAWVYLFVLTVVSFLLFSSWSLILFCTR
jgi:hypothetical protein